MKSFKEFLNEMASAPKEDFDFGNEQLGKPFDIESYKGYNKKRFKIDDLEIYCFNKDGFITCLVLVDNILCGEVFLMPYMRPPTRLDQKCSQIKSADVYKRVRKKNIAKNMYKCIMEAYNVILIGDKEQYLGAQYLWRSLSRDPDYEVGIFSDKTKEVIDTNINLDSNLKYNVVWIRPEDQNKGIIHKTIHDDHILYCKQII